MEDQPTFVLDEKTRKEREEEGRILKREDQLQDISNMDLSKYDQKKTEQLVDKSRELRGKAMEQISDVKSKISETASNLKEGSVQKENKSETQVHHGDKPLTEKTKHDILELTEKLTEKIQALKQSNPSETKASSQTQSFEQKYSPPLQERFEYQSSTERKEIKPEQYKGEVSQSKEQNQPEIKEQQQGQKQEGKSREHQPLVDQVLGRLHSASDSIHHRVEGFKNAFKVEEPKETERVPLIDQLTHSIHNMTDKITGVFKHKGSTPSKQKGPEEETLGSYSIGEEFTENLEGFSKTMERALRELGGETFGGKEYSLTRFEEEREGTLGSYCIGEEFRENFEGFSKIMERALRELDGESFGGKEYSLARFEEEQEADIEPLDFKLPGSRESKGQSDTSGDLGHEFQEFKTQGFEDLSNEGKSSSPGLQATESSGAESSHKGRNILKQLEEDIKIIDQMLEKSIAKRTKYETKESETMSKKSQGFETISNQSAEIGINPKGASNLTRQVYQDVNANDNLLERAILGERSGQREIFESSAANLYSEGLKSKTEMFRDITNVTGQTSISQKAEKDLNNNDKLLDKTIKEGKAGYRYEPEDKENIGKQMQSKGGANISHCEGLRNITETI